MYKILYPKKDATLYERYPDRNTSIDQILELTKLTIGEYVDDVDNLFATWNDTYNSRMLLYFDVASLADNPIDATYYLSIKSTEAVGIPTEYTLYAYPLAQPWKNGNGNFNDDPHISNGVSWLYRSDKLTADPWSGYTMESNVVSGGGSWNSGYVASQSFSNDSPDIRMDITDIVQGWLHDDLPNHGIIVKHSTEGESNNEIYGSIKFFGRESHTIYLPTLQAYWPDDVTYSGSFNDTELINDNYIVYIRNIKDSYKAGEKAKFRLHVRDTFPVKSYETESLPSPQKRLPPTTYFRIEDYVTGQIFVDFNEVGTKVLTDDEGHYILVDMTNFLSDRYYKIVFNVEKDDSITFVDNSFNFKVVK